MMAASNLTSRRPALGQSARVGCLYDAQRDSFLTSSVLRNGATQGIHPFSLDKKLEFSQGRTDSWKERSKILHLDHGLAASYVCGMAGSPGYLAQIDGTGDGPESRALLCSIFTGGEKLDFMDQSLRNALNLAALDLNPSTTHLVAEVLRGFQVIIRASIENGRETPETRADLETCFSEFSRAMTPGYDYSPKLISFTAYTFSIRRIGESTSVRTSDVNLVAQTLADMVKSNLVGLNSTSGPLAYTLLPLSFLSLLFPISQPTTLVEPDPTCLGQFIEIFDSLHTSRNRLRAYLELVQKHRHCVTSSHMDELAIADIKATQSEQLLRSRYAKELLLVRSGVENMQRLWELLKELKDGPLSPSQLASSTGEFEAKIHFVDQVLLKGARYAAFNPQRPGELLSDGEMYILFYYNSVATSNPELWAMHRDLMLDLLENRSGSSCHIVFCDCDGAGPSPPRLQMTHLKNRKVLVADVVDEQRFGASRSLVSCDPKYFSDEDRPKPQHRRAVRIPCPGPSCNPNVLHEWFCSKCRTAIEFGDQDQYLYCDCGYGSHKGYSFRCSETIIHGSSYNRFEPWALMQHLGNLKPYREMNLLILGETGVGKSTFINAFINYLTFETLDEAIANDGLQWIIPCSFSTQFLDQDGSFHQQDIRIGDGKDEVDGSGGQSATQATTVYRIQMGSDLIVRLIDTPGIGDTRGVEQDRKNMAGILSTLASFEALHGILILLKPNSARLTLMFKFCITELLTHLHRDAARNIVFGFTNTRISNYMPGDAFKPLQTLMDKYRHQVALSLHRENTYCFDSESFRYLAALKQTGRPMGSTDDFRRSWKRSEEESRRLLTHFESLEPHLVKGTLSLNRARDLIAKLTKPMAEIMDVINRTIRINEDHMQELKAEKCKGDALKKSMHFKKIDKITKSLSKPRTVCTDDKCVDYVDGVDKKVINYRTHCHK